MENKKFKICTNPNWCDSCHSPNAGCTCVIYNKYLNKKRK